MTKALLAILLLCAVTLFACGTGEDGESASSGGSTGSTNDGECSSKRGPAMALISLAEDSFCIDRTEVTRAQYDAFLQAADVEAGSGYPSWCEGESPQGSSASCMKSDLVCQGDGCGEHPQVCVTVCNAIAFCQWAGKELCGPVGGGIFEQADGQTEIEPMRWRAACGNGLTGSASPAQSFPYGDEYREDACNTGSVTTVPVGSRAGCTATSNADVVDLSGNVWELQGWVTLRSAGGIQDHAMGGSFEANSEPTVDFGCATNSGSEGTSPTFGFRCCKTP